MASLSVRYRPHSFSDVVGQFTVVNTLQRQINEQTFGNSYIFQGKSGSGKTTCARIFADLINEGNDTFIEIDAASNNGVDNIKAIIKSAYERSVSHKYKIYIIDECHMLTIQSFNALLKCIEEPPKYTIFILCTTELNKVPATIKNRCQIFTFNKVGMTDLVNRLTYVCEQENFTNYIDSIKYIARISDGSPRQALTYLDKITSASKDLSLDTTIEILGNFSFDMFYTLTQGLVQRDECKVLNVLSSIHNNGSDLKVFIDEYLTYILGIVKYILFKDISLTNIPQYYESQIKELLLTDSPSKYFMWVADKLLNIKNMIKINTMIDSIIQVEFLKICRWI